MEKLKLGSGRNQNKQCFHSAKVVEIDVESV